MTRFAVLDSAVVFVVVMSGMPVGSLLAIMGAPFAALAVLSPVVDVLAFSSSSLALRRLRGAADDVIYPWWQTQRWALWHGIAVVALSFIGFFNLI